jgi:hypothetical protein
MRLPRLLLALLLLSGCSIYESEWRCPFPPGDGGCRSLNTAYRVSAATPAIPQPPDPTRLAPPPTGTDWTPPVVTIWVAPYLDTAGRRHEASIVRSIVFPGQHVVAPEPEFLIPPVPETTEDGTVRPPVPPPDAGAGAPRQAPPRDRTPRPASPPARSTPGATGSPTGTPGFGLPGY